MERKKIVFIGAGSFIFTRSLSRDILTFEALRDADLWLVDINPELDVLCISEYLNEESIPSLLGPLALDGVVDAIDTLSPKIALIQYCLSRGLFLVSSMGSGSKLDATKVRVDDISRSFQCPLAHMLRKRLHNQ